jgi:uncharacterized membrane-anchored protein
MRDHPHRLALIGEIHARPYPDVSPPTRASHLALLSDEAAGEDERELLKGSSRRTRIASALRTRITLWLNAESRSCAVAASKDANPSASTSSGA